MDEIFAQNNAECVPEWLTFFLNEYTKKSRDMTEIGINFQTQFSTLVRKISKKKNYQFHTPKLQ